MINMAATTLVLNLSEVSLTEFNFFKGLSVLRKGPLDPELGIIHVSVKLKNVFSTPSVKPDCNRGYPNS